MSNYRFIIPFLFFALFFVGCKPEHPPYFYAVTAISANNADNEGETPEITKIDSIEADQYTISLECTNEFRGGGNGHFHPSETAYKNELKITSFNVYTLENFNETHPAGSSLNDYFITGYFPYEHNSLNSYIERGSLGEGRNYESDTISTWTSKQYLYLMESPQEMGEYSFVIDIIQSDGVLLTDTTVIKLYI